MIQNILKTAVRNFFRNMQYSIINLFGFSIGLLSFLLIIIYINHEKHYDSFHEKGDRLYRTGWIMKSPTGENKLAYSTAAYGPSLFEEFPEVVDFTRFSNEKTGFLNYDNNDVKTNSLVYADSSVFSMFSFKVLKGDPKRCLIDPYSIVLTSTLAKKIFGDEDPIGKSLKWNNQRIFNVTGIVEDPPSNSHIQFSALVSFTTLYKYDNIYLDWNGGVAYIAYILLGENSSLSTMKVGLKDFMYKHINKLYEQAGWTVIPHFQKMKDIYMDNTVSVMRSGNPVHNRIFMIVALSILVLVCINFMNLSTARYSTRAGEVAIRKTFGANRGQIIRQFLGESILMIFVGMIIAMILLEAVMPLFRQITGKEINLYESDNVWILVSLPVIVFITGLVAGSYPAFYLSSFSPLSIIRSTGRQSKSNISFRNILVLFQFAISIVLIITTIMVYKQVNFLNTKELGFDKENLVVFPMTSQEFRQKHEILQQEIRKIPGVISTAATSFMPGMGVYREGFKPEGVDNSIMYYRLAGDYGMIGTLGLKLTSGRKFSKDFSTDDKAFIVNESLVRSLGWDDPLGKKIYRNGSHDIIGVVKDYNFMSLTQPITPLILSMEPYDGFTNILVRFKTGNIKALISNVKTIWKSVDPYEPFDYKFVSQELEALYKSELKFGEIFLAFAILAIIIASLGVFGLASFEAERRIREIGIRKVFGSSPRGVVGLLVKKFSIWVLLSNLIAWPVAWYIIHKWLENFAYRTEITVFVFIVAASFTLLTALVTVSMKSLRTSLRSPVESLRYE